MSVPLFKYFPENHSGRDFVIGDLHGMFHTLEIMLDTLEFDKSKDRLFSVGDLIDRGPQSDRVVNYLKQPWFHAIQGNHEQLLLQSINSTSIFKAWTERAGGKWWLKLSDSERVKVQDMIMELPMAFEIATATGQIGIVHADIPIGLAWNRFVKGLQDDPELQQHAQWSRIRHRYVTASESVPKVSGIDLLVVGHSIVDKPLFASNLCYIDTGAAYTGYGIDSRLTMLQIHPVRNVYQQKTSPD
jgi:serine/threonine protein phosphatase 1